MALSLECQELLQSLEQATARLAGLNPEDFEGVENAVRERRRAIEALVEWIAQQKSCSRPVSPDLGVRLARDLEQGAQVGVRLALARAAALRDLKSLSRARQWLRSLSGAAGSEPGWIDCQG